MDILNAKETGVVARLKAFATGQVTGDSAFQSGSTSKSVLRDAIFADLRALNRTAAGAANDLERPELMDRFRMPYGMRDEQLVAEARARLQAGLEHETLLLSYLLDPKLLGQLEARIGEFERATQHKSTGLQSRVGAGQGLDETLAEGLKTLRTLKTLLGNLYARDPAKLAEWQTACRIHRTGSRPAKETGQEGNV